MTGLQKMSYILFISFLTLLTSCSTQKKEVKEEKKEVVIVKETAAMRQFHTLPKDFQILMLGYEGAIRKIDIYESYEKVKSTETAKLVEESDVHLKYNVIKDDLEFARITYMFKDKKVDAIKMSITVHDNIDYEVLLDELTQFFTHKYGMLTINADEDEIWKVKNATEHEVDIISSAKGDKYEIEIDIS